MKTRTFLLILALVAATSCGRAPRREAELGAALDSLLTADYREDSPGAALLVAVDGRIIYDRGIGLADVGTGQKIDGNTNFNIASVSKQFTSAGLLKLQEKGLVSIEDSLSMYFPEYSSPMWNKIRIRHLLSHSSGLPDTRPRSDRQWMLTVTDDESLGYFTDLDSLKFAPGTAYDYINPTFQLVYAIIQKVSGRDFEQYQQDEIFSPAGMNSTCYFRAEREIPRMAHGYIVNDGGNSAESDSGTVKERDVAENDYTDGAGVRWAECDYGEETFFATRADGGIYASTHDLLRWEMALRENKVLSPESKALAYHPWTKVSGSPWCSYQNRPNTWYGLGWFIEQGPEGAGRIYHTGDNGGFQACLSKWDDGRVVVIMLENRNDHDRWAVQTEIERLLRKFRFL